MRKVTEVVPITDLRQDAAAVLQRLRRSHEPLVITQRGRAAAVLLSVEEYERARREREILESLARSDKEIAIGKGYDLDEVLADADAVLANDKA
jgi:prevent-host-death family protein